MTMRRSRWSLVLESWFNGDRLRPLVMQRSSEDRAKRMANDLRNTMKGWNKDRARSIRVSRHGTIVVAYDVNHIGINHKEP
jgi:hypothetical protein